MAVQNDIDRLVSIKGLRLVMLFPMVMNRGFGSSAVSASIAAGVASVIGRITIAGNVLSET